MKRKPFVLVISGPSGVGKSTFVHALLERFPGLHFSVSATTRPQRGHEVDGREYYFLSAAEFRRRQAAGAFLESAEVHGALYGTLAAEVDGALNAGRTVLLDVDVQGGVEVKKRIPDAVLVFLLPPSLPVLAERLRRRGTESAEKIQHRLARAPAEIRALAAYDYVVVNDQIEATRSDLCAIFRAEELRRSRLQDERGGEGFVDDYLKAARPSGA